MCVETNILDARTHTDNTHEHQFIYAQIDVKIDLIMDGKNTYIYLKTHATKSDRFFIIGTWK